MKQIFSANPLWQNTGLLLVRIITGAFLVYHGWEVFSAAKMDEYAQWNIFTSKSFTRTMVYAGKIAELIGGFLLIMGFFTRVACLIIIGTMGFIAFYIGHGKVWYDDQHPFLFVLLAFVFFFTGPGPISVDATRNHQQ